MLAIEFDSVDILMRLYGSIDENISIIEQEIGVTITNRDGKLLIEGTAASEALAGSVIGKLTDIVSRGEKIDRGSIRYCIDMAAQGRLDEFDDAAKQVVAVTAKGKPVKCKTVGQKKYVDALKSNTITFGVGPAGTGKTYLAVCNAVSLLRRGEVDKIILTRPAVEAGEKLGFLPGDLQNKVDPYLRPLYDALGEMLGQENYLKQLEKGIIEIAPLAYMRGRTLSGSYIILDEAQNTTIEQMKMFLTRLGEHSKMVVTGDVTQIDLPHDRVSGLKHAVSVLRDIDNIGIVNLNYKDVVRHELVQNIVKAYDRALTRKEENK